MQTKSTSKLWSALSLAIVLALVFAPLGDAAVWTDQQDYVPGSVVTISGDNSDGAGYLAGEVVIVSVEGPNEYTSECIAIADDVGAWSCQVVLWDSELAYGDYIYTAIGQISGVVEIGTFTDALGLNSFTDGCGKQFNLFDSGDFVCMKATGLPSGSTTKTVTFKWWKPDLNPSEDTPTFENIVSGSGNLTNTMQVIASGKWTVKVIWGNNTATAYFNVRDISAPDIGYTLNPVSPDGENGWYKSNVTLTWTVTENESPSSLVKTGCVDQEITSDQFETTYSCSATSDGGSAGPVEVKIKRDATAPGFDDCPEGGPFLLKSGFYPIGPIGVDASISGLNADLSTLSGTIDTSSVGVKNLNFTAVDNAGNSANKTCSYKVVYDFNGFFAPVDNLPALNAAKAGSAIPVKFSLAGDQGLDIFTTGYPLVKVVSCPNTESTMVEETVAGTVSSLAYDPIEDQYIYVWKTDKKWSGSCRSLNVMLNDETQHVAHFQFK
jgi:hypothetical protein